MPKNTSFQPESGPCLEHPAAIAWMTCRPGEASPQAIEVLKTPSGRYPNQKSRVYRLTGAFSCGSPIYAKLTRAESVRVERMVYEVILPRLEVSRIRCLGTLEAEDEKSWIFLEQALGALYEEENKRHRRLATKWLAKVHTETSSMDFSHELPAHSAARYWHCLPESLVRIEPNLDNPALTSREVKTLSRILELWAIIERKWPELEQACADMPVCLAHGDFVKKNVRIHQEQGGEAVYAMDWDISGWGVPAVDIERMDLYTYEKSVRRHWPHLGLTGVRRMANIGVILRNLGLIHATSVGLVYDWVERTMNEMAIYETCLAEAVHREGWR